jgi:hypothetical protein
LHWAVRSNVARNLVCIFTNSAYFIFQYKISAFLKFGFNIFEV